MKILFVCSHMLYSNYPIPMYDMHDVLNFCVLLDMLNLYFC